MECCKSTVRILENIPILGHMIACCHACGHQSSKAERAGIKATVGILFCLCNAPAECVDEAARKRSPKLQSYALTSRPEWMRIYHRKSLAQICLPGSHQSGTFCIQRKLKQIPMVEGWSQCQVLTFGEQLMGGIRFFDLRVMTDPKDGDIWLHNDMVTCVKLRHVFDVVKEFINDHPSEIVFLYLTNDGKSVDWGLCRSYLHEMLSNRLIHEQMKDMQIGDIVDTGRNVVVSGVPDIAYSWHTIQYRLPNRSYPDDLKDDLEATLTDMGIYRAPSFFWYKAECTPDEHLKSRAMGGLPGAVYCRCAEEKYEFIEDLACAANNVIHEVLTDVKRLPFNVLSTDFVQDDIVERIIELNGKISQLEPSGDLSASMDDVFIDRNGSQNSLRAVVAKHGSQNSLRAEVAKHDSQNSLRALVATPVATSVSVDPRGRVSTSCSPTESGARYVQKRSPSPNSYRPDHQTNTDHNSYISGQSSNPSHRPPQHPSYTSPRHSQQRNQSYTSRRSAHQASLTHASVMSYSSLGTDGSFELGHGRAKAVEVKETTI